LRFIVIFIAFFGYLKLRIMDQSLLFFLQVHMSVEHLLVGPILVHDLFLHKFFILLSVRHSVVDKDILVSIA
jgi:hypothetical protein